MTASTGTSRRLWFDAVVDSQRDRDQRLRRLWQMTPAQRVAAMYRGELTSEECFAWAARYPAQVPTLNGEFWFIAITTPEVCE